jgi:hypothetical protein
MEPFDVLVTAMSSLVMLIVIHLSVFGVIRWMYPPPLPAPQVRFAEPPPPPPSFTEPPHMKQEVNVPTYASPVPVEAASEEGGSDGAKPSSAANERPSWLVAVDPKTLDK